jgi:aryl sulfotransferase
VTRRLVRNHTIDSTRWDDFEFRDGDIVIANWSKSGATWVQQIVAQMVFRGAENVPLWEVSPWIEQRVDPKDRLLAKLSAQSHRRFVKTHLPADALPRSPKAKYLYIARDGRDVVWSWYQHHRRLIPMVYRITNETPGRVGPAFQPPQHEFREYFLEWLERDGYPLWPFWSHVRSWWKLRNKANVLLLHFQDLKVDLSGEMRRIAHFLDVEVDAAAWPRMVEHCTFSYMKAHAWQISPLLDAMFHEGAEAFINKGVSGSWRGILRPEDEMKYQEAAGKNLPPECARWLAAGANPQPARASGAGIAPCRSS